MVAPLTSALSGLQASATRLGAIADNLANINDTAAPPPPTNPKAYTGFVPQVVEQSSVSGGGTAVTLRAVDPAFVLSFAADNPQADAQGHVSKPNVSIEASIAGAAQAQVTYRANVEVLQSANQMLGKVLDIKK